LRARSPRCVEEQAFRFIRQEDVTLDGGAVDERADEVEVAVAPISDPADGGRGEAPFTIRACLLAENARQKR
jgi:hypothetical protein